MSIFARPNTMLEYINGSLVSNATKNFYVGKCVLQLVNINKVAGIAANLKLYDAVLVNGSLPANSKILGDWDLNILNSLGSFDYGLDCNLGLTYVTTGLISSYSVSILYNKAV